MLLTVLDVLLWFRLLPPLQLVVHLRDGQIDHEPRV